MAAVNHLDLARSIHPRLLNFFKRYPPPQLTSRSQSSPHWKAWTTGKTSPAGQTADVSQAEATAPSDHVQRPYRVSDNPFLPYKNPRTGNWRGAAISLRRQAELYKLARLHNVMSLMPLSHKHPEEKERRRVELGLRVQGTGVGKKVKGKLWERTLKGRLEQRRKAMEGMPQMIREWKQTGHGRGWKKWPK